MASVHHMSGSRTANQREHAEDQYSGLPDRGSAPSPAAGVAGRGNGFGRIGGIFAGSRLLDGAGGACDPCHRFSTGQAASAADDRQIRELAAPALAEVCRSFRIWQPAAGAAFLARIPARWNHRVEKNSRKINGLIIYLTGYQSNACSALQSSAFMITISAVDMSRRCSNDDGFCVLG